MAVVITIIISVSSIIFVAAIMDAIKDGKNPRPYREKDRG